MKIKVLFISVIIIIMTFTNCAYVPTNSISDTTPAYEQFKAEQKAQVAASLAYSQSLAFKRQYGGVNVKKVVAYSGNSVTGTSADPLILVRTANVSPIIYSNYNISISRSSFSSTSSNYTIRSTNR